MKKLAELIRFISMPVFSVIFIAVLILDASLYQSISTNTETNVREIGDARLAWIQQSLERYVDITEVMESRVAEAQGERIPDVAKLADFVKMDAALRSIQIIQADGRFSGFNQDANIRDFRDLSSGSLKDLADYTKRTGYVSITPSIEVGEGLHDIVVLRPVFLTGEQGTQHFWGYILAIIDTDIFLSDANIKSLEGQNILCGLFHTEENGTVSGLYENGAYRKDAVKQSRNIYGDQWTIYLRPQGPWVNPWIIFLTTWAGILTAIALAVLVRRNASLRLMGTTDALTGVYNRNGGDLAVGKYLEVHEEEPALVMAVDIDNFKIINDVYGHEAGDRALCHFTEDMKETFGKHIFITRSGGDEFIIFAAGRQETWMTKAIEQFTGTPHVFSYNGQDIHFSASLGYACYPSQDRDYRSLVLKADYALYNAKLNGKAGWRKFEEELTEENTRTQLGFNLTDIGNEMPGAMLVYEAENKKILFASSRLIKIMECGNLDDFMNYTCSHVFRLFPQGQEEGIQKEIERQMNRSDNRRRLYFVHALMMTKKGNVKPVSMMGHLNHNANYGDLFYVFLYEERGKAEEAPGAV
ncbi:diguanylate cyclase [Dialister sp.]|uniref:sensor domain-containing diguanylate cyclase n=1 Tax=Dialister sp. TaxID=1955814 RepID=UPI003EFF304A